MGQLLCSKLKARLKGWKTVVWNGALSASGLLYLTDQLQTPAKPLCTKEHIVAREPGFFIRLDSFDSPSRRR